MPKMKFHILCFSLLMSTFSLICVTKSSSSSVSLLGIPPQDEDYFKPEFIKCKNGSKKFTRAQLNDDFCDCPDGTDEPGTSACPQGKFYCHNVGHLPISLPSSRVNDGICDCCDGNDEYDGKVKCRNTCWEAGKVARDKLQKKIDMYKEGATLRKKEIEQAKQAIANDEKELLKLKNEKKTLKILVKQLKAHKEQIEKAEEKERLEKDKEEKTKKVSADKDEAGDKSDNDQKGSFSSSNDNIRLSNESTLDKQEKDEYENMESLSNDASESTEGLSREELGRLVASRWTGGKAGSEADGFGSNNNRGGSTETSESTNYEVYDNNNDKKSSIGNDLDSSKSKYKSHLEEQKDLSGKNTLGSSSWLEKIKDTVRNILDLVNVSPPPVDKLDADHIRKEYDDATTRLSDVEAKISTLTEKLKHDFGTEKEFYRLYDQCFETKQDKYVYKVCPFKEATQEEGYHKTQLGEWEKFENSYRIMLFSNGQGCWNGPERSLKVKLRCGLKTELTDVDEPSRCEYAALMTTPVLCLEGKLEEFKHKLQAMDKEEQPDSHDEL
ncbi:glucosidase 2 subunit beta isoform X1 [Ricinus communis]|uniref:glucosidase 2 subunit beta isoform X1 n=1 Tax=Ricinus communis TaxID=3988 RepID=UPI000772549C|nr:glucosidase 2 subunit beta isoform X1 [Ricinus communis]|eukprot:XP_015578681.1 glucosidase 2 subunit beta isoform X1 [Ricinus communis]